MKKVLNRIPGSSFCKAAFRKAVFRGYGFPVLVSLLLHASLLLVLSTSWSVDRQLNIVPPRSIKASLVEVPAPKPQPRPQVDDSARKAREAAERKRQKAIREERQRLQAEEKRQREIALRKEREAQEKAKKAEDARKERERQRKLEAERKRQQEVERQRKQREETLRQLEQERIQREQQEAAAQQAEEQAEKDAAEVRYYSELLNNLIVNNWNRPPSARNNMTALLQVTLSPFGDLLEVKLLEGSGNDSFDRSAVQAVQRAAPFPELKKLERRIFDANFRRFNFRFRPEDLVR
ncbi:cell envelope integrity protein TolA [Endozoicomonas euniceicola]|uniref:Cell envelope integrity protein TolA n=1 Tax=Endozoicomonas euniceicola TaxID=1234143 RepID=A0ABY6GVI8_9GAMM|nr:cell envelope integrity protein TolA [Endozoicomonas euniceicola]UYM16782.1 cell envelope integrity protein TolA [Endozoicomonas euniceicola]